MNLTSSIDTVKLDVLDVQKNVNMENGNRGTFTAPVSGFYSFSFSAQGDTDIVMYRNDKYDFRIADHNKNGNYDMENIAYSWNIRLDQNDRIYLKLTEESNSLFCK